VKYIARFLLRMMTLAVPVVIAACYGVPQDYTLRNGRVVDKDTQRGIPGIKVTCLTGDAGIFSTLTNGSMVDAGLTTLDAGASTEDGTFQLNGGVDCTSLLAEDVDGPANGGSYAPVTQPFDSAATTITILMTKQ
jgi:hypothetical protein